MYYLVYYKTHKNILRHNEAYSPKEMWEAINKALDKGYTVTEINAYGQGWKKDYTLHFDLQGTPVLREFAINF